MRRIVLWLVSGTLLTAATTYVPPVVARNMKKLEPRTITPVRLAFTPAAWPDPNITWQKAIPGFEELTSMRGFGVEHMMIVTRYRTGWPFTTLEGFSRVEYTYDLGTKKSTVLDQGAESTTYRWGTTVPTGLRLGGVTANLALFTLASAICISGRRGVRALIARRRRSSGRCERCAYPLGDRPICPECGAPANTSEPARAI